MKVKSSCPGETLRNRVDLETDFKGLKFRNPVTVSSGTFGTKDEYLPFIQYKKLGAIVTKTITVKPRIGNPMPRICETPAGMLNAIGLQNKGLKDFIAEKIPFFAKIPTPLIVNIAGETLDEFETLTRELNSCRDVVKALEINLSCPNVEGGGVSAMRKRKKIRQVAKTVRSRTRLPVIAKLSPELGELHEIVSMLIDEGVDGVTLINTLKGMAVDIRRRRPKLANLTGGLSGPAIKPVALRYVYEIKKRHKIFVVASGGIMNAEDALEFLITGADMVSVGTASFVMPRAAEEVIVGISDYCKASGIWGIKDLRGSLQVNA